MFKNNPTTAKNRLKNVLPDYYEEVKTGILTGESSDDLNASLKTDLATQLDGLYITGACACYHKSCASLSVSTIDDLKASNESVRNYSHSIDIMTHAGHVIIDVDHDNRILGFENWERKDLRSRLLELNLQKL